MTAAQTERIQPERIQAQHIQAEPLPQAEPVQSDDDLVLADLLVEEISIDGMCGVY